MQCKYERINITSKVDLFISKRFQGAERDPDNGLSVNVASLCL